VSLATSACPLPDFRLEFPVAQTSPITPIHEALTKVPYKKIVLTLFVSCPPVGWQTTFIYVFIAGDKNSASDREPKAIRPPIDFGQEQTAGSDHAETIAPDRPPARMDG